MQPFNREVEMGFEQLCVVSIRAWRDASEVVLGSCGLFLVGELALVLVDVFFVYSRVVRDFALKSDFWPRVVWA